MRFETTSNFKPQTRNLKPYSHSSNATFSIVITVGNSRRIHNKKYLKRVLFNRIVSLFLPWFFIGYWILKTGLDFYPGPFLFYNHSVLRGKKSRRYKAQGIRLKAQARSGFNAQGHRRSICSFFLSISVGILDQLSRSCFSSSLS